MASSRIRNSTPVRADQRVVAGRPRLRWLSPVAFPAKVARGTAPVVDSGEGTPMVESGSDPDTIDTSSLRALVRDVPDFPQAGIIFRDITPLLGNGAALRSAVDALAGLHQGIDSVIGIESRGFILGAPVAYALGVGMVPVRKLGRLPRATERADYALEYGTNTVEIHADALRPGERVLIIDDVLATGGTAAATAAAGRAPGRGGGGDRGPDRASGARRTRAIGGLPRHQPAAVLTMGEGSTSSS